MEASKILTTAAEGCVHQRRQRRWGLSSTLDAPAKRPIPERPRRATRHARQTAPTGLSWVARRAAQGSLWFSACLVLLGCEGKPSPGAKLEPGQALALTILEKQDCPPAESATSQEDVKRWLGLKVKLTAGVDQLPANYFYASLVDPEGNAISVQQSGCKPLLSAAPLKAGDSAEGFVNFTVPRTKKEISLRYAPRLGDPDMPKEVSVEVPVRL